MLDLYVFTFHDDGRVYRALSLLSPEEVEEYGLPTEAVLGEISALLPDMTPDQFEANEDFVDFLHEIVQQHAPEDEELQLEAKSQGTGHLYVIDGRARGEESILSEDIIGRFEIARGEIQADRYEPNEEYEVLTEKGPPQLPEQLMAALLNAARAKAADAAAE